MTPPTATGSASPTHKLERMAGPPPSSSAASTGAFEEFALATSPEEFCRAWLRMETNHFVHVRRAAVFAWDAAQATPSLIAAWPNEAGDVEELLPSATQAATRKRGLGVLPAAEAGWRLAHPVVVGTEVRAVVVFELAVAPDDGLPAALGRLQSAASGLEAFLRRGESGEAGVVDASGVPTTPVAPVATRLRGVVDLVASALGSEKFLPCAQTFVSQLATRLRCDRVSIGFIEAGRIRIRAVSDMAEFRRRTGLVRALSAAMEEALDQKSTVIYPDPPGRIQVVLAHEVVARTGPSAVCTVPFAHGTRLVGAVTLERSVDSPFDTGTVELIDAAAALAGPALNALRREDRWLGAKAVDSLRAFAGALVGLRHTGLKLGVLAAAGAAAFLVLAEGDRHVTARAVMEPRVRRAAVAPVRGYLREAPVRAGDRVERGQVLAAFDDRELRLERAKWESQRTQLERQRNAALAQLNAAQVGIAAAQMDQAAAHIALLDTQLGQMRVESDVDGIVVSGDLSQSLGSPIDKGQLLFEIAPLDAYRLVLQVDERDIGTLAVGQRGQAVLTAAPADGIGFTVKQITPVSTAVEGRNYFRVEAALDVNPAGLRPGLEGVAKAHTGRARLIELWTRPVVDWLRLAVWSWTP